MSVHLRVNIIDVIVIHIHSHVFVSISVCSLRKIANQEWSSAPFLTTFILFGFLNFYFLDLALRFKLSPIVFWVKFEEGQYVCICFRGNLHFEIASWNSEIDCICWFDGKHEYHLNGIGWIIMQNVSSNSSLFFELKVCSFQSFRNFLLRGSTFVFSIMTLFAFFLLLITTILFLFSS